MIPLPKSAEVTRNRGAEGELHAKARHWIEGEERTPGLHASDFLDPRQRYWNAVDPQPLNDREIVMFLVGKVLHALVLHTEGPVDLSATDTGSSFNEVLQCSFSPDARLVDGKVAELKTTRSYYAPDTIGDLALYLEQLLVYMVATETTESQLWILYLNLKDETGRTTPSFRCYDFRVSPEDLAATQSYLVALKDEIALAISTTNHARLPLCREFKCGANNCKWYSKCKPEGRYGDPIWDGTAPRPKRSKKA